MNKNATPIILIALSLGMYFTFTKDKIDELKTIQIVNAEYQKAITTSKELIKKRDEVLSNYNKIDPKDQENLNKMVPDNVDNVRLIIDLNGIAAKHGMSIRNIKTVTTKDTTGQNSPGGQRNVSLPGTYNTVLLSFDVSASYSNFLAFLRDVQTSLRLIEVSKISLRANDLGNYDYGLEIKTFWLKE